MKKVKQFNIICAKFQTNQKGNIDCTVVCEVDGLIYPSTHTYAKQSLADEYATLLYEDDRISAFYRIRHLTQKGVDEFPEWFQKHTLDKIIKVFEDRLKTKADKEFIVYEYDSGNNSD